MSYILDALKKSEQERQRNTTPDIHTVHAVPGLRGKRGAVWPYLLSTALIANVGLMLWWLQPWQSARTIPLAQTSPVQEGHNGNLNGQRDGAVEDASTATAQRAKNPEPNPPKAEEPASKTSKMSPTRDNVSSRPAANTVPSIPQAHREPPKSKETEPVQEKSPPKADVKKTLEPPSGAARKTDEARLVSAEIKKKASSSPNETAAGSAPSPRSNREITLAELLSAYSTGANESVRHDNAARTQGGLTESPDENRAEKVPETVASFKERAATAPEPKSPGERESPSDRDIKKMHQLPQAVRKDLPNLSFSMFVYSENPAKRLVSYNGRVIREGQEIAPGLKLERITRNGVVLNFRGHRFEKEEF